MTIRIKNWEKFQHYRNRRPPWIRLYRDLLDDPDFEALDGELVKTLIKLWLAVSDFSVDGTLPSIERLALRMHVASKLLAEQLMQLNQWLDCDASTLLAYCKQVARPEGEQIRADQSRSEGDTERECAPARTTSYTREFESFRDRYPGHRRGGKSQDWKSWKVAKKAGMTSEQANEYLTYWLQSKHWRDGYVVALSKWLRDGYWDTMPIDGPDKREKTQHQRNLEVLGLEEEDGERKHSVAVSCDDIRIVPRQTENQ